MKISIQANGDSYEVVEGSSIETFLEALDLTLKLVVVEYNGVALTRAQAAEVRLAAGDSLEIVRIVAGG